MAKKINCHCGGRPACRLCNGTGAYLYQPGARGWMPFRCPTCAGSGQETSGGETCPTCRGAGTVDPADPPTRGLLDVLSKSLLGA